MSYFQNLLRQLSEQRDNYVAPYSDVNGSNYLLGTGGRDWIGGGGGTDKLDGGGGDDFLRGGLDADWMTGGAGHDTFFIKSGDSKLDYSNADVISDFQTGIDHLRIQDSSEHDIWGTPSNTIMKYFTHEPSQNPNAAYQNNFGTAQDLAWNDIHNSHGQKQFAFYTDGYNGYLFADTNHDSYIDTAIELRGLNSLNAFSPWDLK